MKELLCSARKQQRLIVSFDITVGEGQGRNETTGEQTSLYGYNRLGDSFGSTTLDSLVALYFDNAAQVSMLWINDTDLLPLSDVILKKLDDGGSYLFSSDSSEGKAEMKSCVQQIFTDKDVSKTITCEIYEA